MFTILPEKKKIKVQSNSFFVDINLNDKAYSDWGYEVPTTQPRSAAGSDAVTDTHRCDAAYISRRSTAGTHSKGQPGGATPTHTIKQLCTVTPFFQCDARSPHRWGESEDTTVHLVSETWRGHLPFSVQLIFVSIPLWLQCKQVQALLSTDFCRTTHRQSNPTAGKMHIWRTGAANAPRLAETKKHSHTDTTSTLHAFRCDWSARLVGR